MSDRSEPMLQMTRVVLLAVLLASATPAARAAPPAARDTPTPAVPAAVPGAPGETGSASSTPAEPAPAASAAAPAAEGATPATEGAADTRGLDQEIQDLKKDVVDLNKDLFILEEELLFPANTQVAVFLSMDIGTFFALDSVTLKLDQREVINYLYTPRAVAAVLKGGVEPPHVGHLSVGPPELAALLGGKGARERASTSGA